MLGFQNLAGLATTLNSKLVLALMSSREDSLAISVKTRWPS